MLTACPLPCRDRFGLPVGSCFNVWNFDDGAVLSNPMTLNPVFAATRPPGKPCHPMSFVRSRYMSMLSACCPSWGLSRSEAGWILIHNHGPTSRIWYPSSRSTATVLPTRSASSSRSSAGKENSPFGNFAIHWPSSARIPMRTCLCSSSSPSRRGALSEVLNP